MRRFSLLSLLLLSIAGSPANAAQRGSRPLDRYLVLIVLDGFRPDYMTLAPMRNLHVLMRTGYSYNRAWVGQLETETPTGHATLATGVYPRTHGVIGFGWRDPGGQTFSYPAKIRPVNAGELERVIEAGGVPTISDLIHRYIRGAKTASISTEKYYAADAMGTGGDYILYGKSSESGIKATPIGRHIPPAVTRYQSADVGEPAVPPVQDQFVAQLGTRLMRTVHTRALLLNMPGSDILGHATGGIVDRASMTPVVAGVDRAIGTVMRAYKSAGIYNRTVFVVTADHGMLPNSHLVPIKPMYAAVRRTGAASLEDDFLTTAGYIFLRDPAEARRVAAGIEARHFSSVEGALFRSRQSGHFAFQADPATARALGPALTRTYLHLCNTLAAPSGPDIVLPYVEDAMGLRNDGNGPHWGTHGGLSWRAQHIPLIISGPGVRHGVSGFPAQLIDVTPTVERLLGLPIPGRVDGVVLADALSRPSSTEAKSQRRVATGRSQDVTQLLLHSLRQNGIYAAK